MSTAGGDFTSSFCWQKLFFFAFSHLTNVELAFLALSVLQISLRRIVVSLMVLGERLADFSCQGCVGKCRGLAPGTMDQVPGTMELAIVRSGHGPAPGNRSRGLGGRSGWALCSLSALT